MRTIIFFSNISKGFIIEKLSHFIMILSKGNVSASHFQMVDRLVDLSRKKLIDQIT